MTVDSEKKQTLTVSTIRNANMVNILQSIMKNQQKTRSELAKENQISIMTVKHIVDDLMRAGIIVERASTGGEVGRKPKTLEFSEAYGNIVCINLTSAEEISFLVYDIKETLLKKGEIAFQKQRSYQENLIEAISEVKKQVSDKKTLTVGVAVFVPSAYYEEKDLVNYDLIPEFKNLKIKALFAEAFQMKNILVLHDVVPAAKSEYDSLNASKESQFYFYCGYGIGGFFIHNGMAIMGKDLMAGEVGKMILPVKTASKQFITLEEVASVSAICRQAQEKGIMKNFQEMLEDYEQQEPQIRMILDFVLDTIAMVLYNLLWVYNPNRVIIDSCYKKYSAFITERFQSFLNAVQNEAIPMQAEIRQAKYDEYHMMRGCFHMVRDAWIEEIAEQRKSIEEAEKEE